LISCIRRRGSCGTGRYGACECRSGRGCSLRRCVGCRHWGLGALPLLEHRRFFPRLRRCRFWGRLLYWGSLLLHGRRGGRPELQLHLKHVLLVRTLRWSSLLDGEDFGLVGGSVTNWLLQLLLPRVLDGAIGRKKARFAVGENIVIAALFSRPVGLRERLDGHIVNRRGDFTSEEGTLFPQKL